MNGQSAKLDRETALTFSNELLEDWFSEDILRVLTIADRQELTLAFACLYVKTAHQLEQEANVAWAKPDEVQPHF